MSSAPPSFPTSKNPALLLEPRALRLGEQRPKRMKRSPALPVTHCDLLSTLPQHGQGPIRLGHGEGRDAMLWRTERGDRAAEGPPPSSPAPAALGRSGPFRLPHSADGNHLMGRLRLEMRLNLLQPHAELRQEPRPKSSPESG